MSDLNFKKLNLVNNPQSIHGIYPYRGKIASIEAKQVISQIAKGARILDPFCGSGTILYESVVHGLEAYGVDNNPLAIWITKGKIDAHNGPLERFEREANKFIEEAKLKSSVPIMDPKASKHFHIRTAEEIMSLVPYMENMSPYLKSVFLGTIALAARGCNNYKWTSSTVGKDIVPKRYIPFYEKLVLKLKKHYPKTQIRYIKPKVFLEDSRILSRFIPLNSIDVIFTSPPYFDGLDYTSYYAKIIYSILGSDRDNIRNGLIQSMRTYEQDMKLVLEEIVKVTKQNALIIFIVGDKKKGNHIINGGEFFSKLIQHKPTDIVNRAYTATSSQIFDKLNNTQRKEQIVIWDKNTW